MSESNLLPVKKQNKKLLFEILETFFAWCWKEKSIGRRRRGTSKQNLIDLHEWVHSAEDRLPVGSSSALQCILKFPFYQSIREVILFEKNVQATVEGQATMDTFY